LYKQTAVVGFLLTMFNSILLSTEIRIVYCPCSATLTPRDPRSPTEIWRIKAGGVLHHFWRQH